MGEVISLLDGSSGPLIFKNLLENHLNVLKATCFFSGILNGVAVTSAAVKAWSKSSEEYIWFPLSTPRGTYNWEDLKHLAFRS